jgi:hypothetical protein
MSFCIICNNYMSFCAKNQRLQKAYFRYLSEKLMQTATPVPQFVENAVLKLRSNPAQSTVGHKFTKISTHR